MENSKELIGILQAISIFAKNLAEKLIRIDREMKEYESVWTTGIIDTKRILM